MNTFHIQGGQDVNTTSFSLCQYPGTGFWVPSVDSNLVCHSQRNVTEVFPWRVFKLK